MRLATVAVLLGLSGGLVAGVPLNFVNKYMTFFRITPIFGDWELSVPVGSAMFLTAVAAAQYGFLPVKSQHLVRGAEAISRHWRARSRPRYRSRQPRAAPLPHTFQSLLTTLQWLEEGAGRYGERLQTDRQTGRS